MAHDDEQRLESAEDENEERSAEQIEDGELEDVAGGMRMNPVASKLGKQGGRRGLTIQPRGNTAGIRGLTFNGGPSFDEDLEGL
jgi:hypothetical protein